MFESSGKFKSSGKKTIVINKDYFVCLSIDCLSKLMQRGYFPVCTKKSCKFENTWLWYFDTTEQLVEEVRDIFPDRDVIVVDD